MEKHFAFMRAYTFNPGSAPRKRISTAKRSPLPSEVSPRRMAAVMGFIAIFGYLSFTWFPKLNWVLTDSVPHYLLIKSDKEIGKGDYVSYHLTNYLDDMKKIWVTKQAACMPGDHLFVQGRNYFCNNEFLGQSKELSLKGQPLEAFIYDGVIPDNRVFLMTDHQDGFDSRYWGLVPLDALKRYEPII